MGIAALILGIVGLVIAWIPFCGILALIPCLVGLGLGIADIIVKGKRGEPKGMGIAGTVLNAVALLIVILWSIVFAAQTASLMSDPEFKEAFSQEFKRQLEEAEKKADQDQNGVVVSTEEVEVQVQAPAGRN